MTNENKKLVDRFLNEIRKHLPDWLKDDKAKLDLIFGIVLRK